MNEYFVFPFSVLRRLASLIAKEATLMAECEASIKQAQSATTVAQQLLEDKGTKDDNKKVLQTTVLLHLQLLELVFIF